MWVDFGSLAVQAGPRPGGDLAGEALPDVPGGDEAAGCSLGCSDFEIKIRESSPVLPLCVVRT